MNLYDLCFYFFSIVAVFSSLIVISAKNTVHSVLFLILSFINGSALFILLGAEFLAMILIVVYVGAVAVLFLFVVMMLDINFVKIREGFLQYMPLGILLGVVLLTELILVLISKKMMSSGIVNYSSIPNFSQNENTKDLGEVLYTDYFLLFQLSGFILLIAMIGSITLTLRTRSGVKKQNIFNQVNLVSKEQIIKKKVPLNKGIE